MCGYWVVPCIRTGCTFCVFRIFAEAKQWQKHSIYGNTKQLYCRGGNLPPTGPEGRNRGTFVSVTIKLETPVIQALSVSGVEESTTWDNEPPQDKNCHMGRFLDCARNDMSGGGTVQPNGLYFQRSQPLPGLDGVGSTPLHCFVYGVLPFTGTGCIRYVAGGRLPPLR